MAPWKLRIGSDIWRNLIAEESRAAKDLYPKEFETSASRAADPNQSALCYRLVPSGNSTSPSYAVFLAGRWFLVGVPKSVTRYLAVLRPAGETLPWHVVLLSWDEGHTAGLPELAAAKLVGTVWTSLWVWEEVLRSFAAESPERRDPLLSLTPATPQSVEAEFDEADPLNAEKPNLTNRVVACDRHMDLALADGVRLALSYVPAYTPALKVRFNCNRLSLTLDPFNVADAGGVETLRGRLADVTDLWPTLREPFLIRYGSQLARAADPQAHERWLEPEGGPNALEGSVDLSACRPEAGAVFAPSPALTARPVALPPKAPPTGVLSRTAVMILCGGLAGKKRAVIDPGRKLGVGGEVVSILAWRLKQLDAWAKSHTVPALPVLLMVSPDTAGLVDTEVNWFRVSFPKARVAIEILHQQLVPIVVSEKGRFRPKSLPDGGWSLTSRGHLDFLHMLQLWAGDGRPPLEVAFVFAHNNLGNLLDETTVARLDRFAGSGADLAVELVRLTRPADPADPRWAQLSYLGDDGPRLFKDGVYPPDPKIESPEWWSTQTWYVSLRTAAAPAGDGPSTRFLGPAKPGGPFRVWQDAELLTHDDRYRIGAFRDESPAPGEGGRAADGFTRYDRFLVVRTEDHLRDPSLHERLTKLYPGPEKPEKPEEEADDERPEQPFLETVPAEMNYVWGGSLISLLKGLAPHRIAETWDVSEHPSGPSAVYQNLWQAIPLPEVMRQRRGTLGYMAKYLDCHGPLSVQVHPDARTAKYLFDKKNFHVTDEYGKEESFYVLRAARLEDDGPPHLYLGFDRDALKGIADRLRPVLEGYAGRGADRLTECYARVVEELHAALGHEVGNRFDNFSVLPGVRDLVLEAVAPASVDALKAARDRPEGGVTFPLELVFEYHVKGSGGGASPLHLLDKEYVFAAVGVIRMIEAVEGYFRNGRHEPELCARRLFGDPNGATGGPTFLSYFRRQKVNVGDWGRVPAGVAHSWQGGGNFLVELAQPSDNTFRILDFGRELGNASRRQMHYTAAMFAISPDGIVGESAAKRLVLPAAEQLVVPATERRPCHSALGYELYGSARAGKNTWVRTCNSSAGAWSVLMNPDDGVQLRTVKGPFASLSVGPCRAVLVEPGTSFEFLPAQPDNTVLHVFPREPDPDLLCVSLGDTKLEVARVGSDGGAAVVWRQGELPARTEDVARRLPDAIRAVVSCLRVHPELTTTGSRPKRVAVAWPGPVDGNRLFSSVLGKATKEEFQAAFEAAFKAEFGWDITGFEVLNDSVAGVRGELYHPQGGLSHKAAGMLLNIGSGLCAAFYLPPTRDLGPDAARNGAVGRWLDINPLTGELSVHDELVFTESPSLHREGRVRTTGFLSSRGIALRFLSRVAANDSLVAEFCAYVGQDVGWWIAHLLPGKPEEFAGRFAQAVTKLGERPDRFQVHRVIARINELAVAGGEAERAAVGLIIEVAHELAGVIRHIGERGPNYKACTRRVVLSGSVGTRFGRVPWKGAPDLLLHVLGANVGRRYEVKRSAISVSCVREAYGFRDHPKQTSGGPNRG